MPAPLRLGLDLDGVFVNFNDGFAQLLTDISGRRLVPAPPHFAPSTWAWPAAVGYKQSEQDEAWRRIEVSPSWWDERESLHHHVMTNIFFRHLSKAVDAGKLVVYFLTARPGLNAHWQSVNWLTRHGMKNPQVIVTAGKGLTAALLALDVVVDDFHHNLSDVAAQTQGRCRTALVEASYNQSYRAMFTYSLACELTAIDQWLERLLADHFRPLGEPAGRIPPFDEPPSDD